MKRNLFFIILIFFLLPALRTKKVPIFIALEQKTPPFASTQELLPIEPQPSLSSLFPPPTDYSTITPTILTLSEKIPENSEPESEDSDAALQEEEIIEPSREDDHDWFLIYFTEYNCHEGGSTNCFNDQPLVAGRSIAADLTKLPLGTHLYIEGVGERIVEDTTSESQLSIVRSRCDYYGAYAWVDIYLGEGTPDSDGCVRAYIIE